MFQKVLKSSSGALFRLRKIPKCKRTFLSKAYSCDEDWNKRLESSLLKQIKPGEIFLELDQKFQTAGRVNAVDIDIFANVIRDDSHIDELADVLHRLRLTTESSFTLDSTHHAVIRYHLENSKTNELLNILDDRLNYGIFPDHFCLNLLMDYFIKKEEFGSAARVATLLMLQEDAEHPIATALAIYSCHKYLENQDSWIGVDPETLKDPEPEEEVKIRVAYIRNPFFDDHFDLWKPSDLVGKTLVFFGKNMGDDPLGRSLQLRGLILYKKYQKAIDLIKDWKIKNIKPTVFQEVLSLIKKDIENIEKDSIKELVELLSEMEENTADLQTGNMTEVIVNNIKTVVRDHEENDIVRQKQRYLDYEETRDKVLKKCLEEQDRAARLKRVAEMKKELEEKEQILTFFENEEQIELAIEAKLEREKKIYGDYEDKLASVEENYIPPEIVKKRM